MSLESQALIDAVVSHAMTTGQFDLVNAHEPKTPPGSGLSAAVWVDRISPTRFSGLASTTGLVVLNVRVTSSMNQEPQDMIDPNIMEAVDALMTAYSGDFTLDGLVRNVDLLGQTGIQLEARAGYLKIGDKMMRVMVLTVPLIVDDLWVQTP